MKNEKNEIENVNTQEITTQSLCSINRKCCLEPGCKATYVHLQGSTWEFWRCGCSTGSGDIT